MNTIVPYVARTQYARNTARSAVFNAAKYAYANRKQLAKAAVKLQRSFRKRKRKGKFAMRTVKSKKVSRTEAINDSRPGDQADLLIGRLYTDTFRYPIITADNFLGVGRRRSNRIFLKGIKICRQFYYSEAGVSGDIGPLEIHYALLQRKSEIVDTNINDGFFRSNVFSNIRNDLFRNHTQGEVWDMSKNCQPINPDGKYNIITHRKKVITPPYNQSYVLGKQVWTIKKYFKLNTEVTFTASTDQQPKKPFLEVFWYQTETPRKFDTVDAATDYVKTVSSNTIYFKDRIS